VSLLGLEELGEELLPLLDGSLEELELEPGELEDPLELGLEPELDPGEVLEPEDEDEPDGEDGSVLEDEPLEDLSREAPPELAPLSQP
jgi:hypothetical protein